MARSRRLILAIATAATVSLPTLLLAGCGSSATSTNTLTGAAAPPSSVRPPAEADVVVSPFVTTAVDRESTFGLDVDTGSYTMGRQTLRQGRRPAPESVRVEEYVNYFQQDYPAPVGADFGIFVDGAPTPFLTDPSHRMVRVGIRARDVSDSFRKPAKLTFLVDTSGSMDQPNRLPLVKQSLLVLVDELGADDSVAIVEFGSTARVVLEGTSGAEKERIRDAVESLETNGSTNAEAGLMLAYQLADTTFAAGAINRVVLASDGGANVGVVDGSALARQIGTHAEKGIQLATVGFGMGDYNDVLMEQLADKGDGFYSYVDDIGEAERLFSEKLTSTLETVALDAKAQVTFDPANVTRYRLVGYENRDVPDIMFRQDPTLAGPKAKGGQINAGHRMTALYEVELSPAAQVTPGAPLGVVTTRWTRPDIDVPVEVSEPMTTDRLAAEWGSASAWFRLDAVVAQYAETLRGSPWIRGTLADVAVAARALPTELARDPDVVELVDLVDQASRAPGPVIPVQGER